MLSRTTTVQRQPDGNEKPGECFVIGFFAGIVAPHQVQDKLPAGTEAAQQTEQ